jgi:hypothetical protein
MFIRLEAQGEAISGRADQLGAATTGTPERPTAALNGRKSVDLLHCRYHSLPKTG